MTSRKVKSLTADLFAAEASPPPALIKTPVSLKAGGIPPTPQTVGHAGVKQLWYAVVFPTLAAPDAALLKRLCLHAQQFTSFVSIEQPNALLLEIKGSLKLFGSLERLHAGIDVCWRRLELEAHSATAPTLAALWFARAGPLKGAPIRIEAAGALPGHLAGLPIACTGWDVARLQTLRAMGVTHLGELMRLPRAGLARRLGTATVQDLDIALARQFAPRRAFVPRERFRALCDFEMEIESAAYLEKALEPLIARCARFLRERQAGVQALRLKLRHRERAPTCVHVGLASVTSEQRRLTDVLSQKLQRLVLDSPVRGMELISGSLQPLIAASIDAFAGGLGTGGCGAPQLVERLRARLGEGAVYGVMPIPEHRPEAAWRRVHELPVRPGHLPLEPADPSGDRLPRPVWLLDAPLPLESGLVLEQGPERIESGWWDGGDVTRDYYIARQAQGSHQPHGAKLWVFQERRSKHWYLHGMFA